MTKAAHLEQTTNAHHPKERGRSVGRNKVRQNIWKEHIELAPSVRSQLRQLLEKEPTEADHFKNKQKTPQERSKYLGKNMVRHIIWMGLTKTAPLEGTN